MMCWLTAEWVTLISWAACVTLPRRATASKLRRLATGGKSAMVISQSVSRYVNVTTGLAGFIAAANRLKKGLNAASVGIAQGGLEGYSESPIC